MGFIGRTTVSLEEMKSAVRRIGRYSILTLLTITFIECSNAQEINLSGSTMYDDNIFNMYIPLPDRITNLQLNAAGDWDADPLSFGLYYTGEAYLYRDLTTRNYHVHALAFNAMYQLYSDDEESDHSDSSDDEGSPKPIATQYNGATPPAIHLDSLDRTFYLNMVALSQFDKGEFTIYDNSRISSALSFRQPLGVSMSLRPSYMFSYHYYPNLSGFTNVEQVFSVAWGTNYFSNGWILIGAHFGHKNYPVSLTFTSTVTLPGNGGQGNGNGNGKRVTETIRLDSPPVNQAVSSFEIVQAITKNTRMAIQYNYFGKPSGVARTLPDQGGGTTSEADIFDDHYSFCGSDLNIQADQKMPFQLTLHAGGIFQSKTYTFPAMDLSDSIVVADHREDRRWEYILAFARPIPFGSGKYLRLMFEYHYYRNYSNAEVYNFGKNTFLFGAEYNF